MDRQVDCIPFYDLRDDSLGRRRRLHRKGYDPNLLVRVEHTPDNELRVIGLQEKEEATIA